MYRGLGTLLLASSLGCAAQIKIKTNFKPEAFQVKQLPAQIYRPGDRVPIKGEFFFGKMKVEIAGVEYPVEFPKTSKAELGNETDVSFILPTEVALLSSAGTKSGKLAVDLKRNNRTVALDYVYLAEEKDFPLITSDPAWICSTKQFYNAKGELSRGTKSCAAGSEASALTNCAKANEQNCIAAGSFFAAKPCNGDGDIGCNAVSPSFRAAATSGLADKVIAGQSVAGISGNVALPSNAKVLSGVTYGIGGNTLVGTLKLPPPSLVLSSNGTYGDPSAPITPSLANIIRPAAPMLTSSSFSLGPDRLSLSWSTVPEASGYIVLLQPSPITWTPTDTVTYATGVYGSAIMIYSGAGTSVTYNTAATAGNNYFVAIYAYQTHKIYSATPASSSLLSCLGLQGGSWVSVPGDSIYKTSSFCVQKYAAANIGGVPTALAATARWDNPTQNEARAACANIDTGYHLITNPEWMTLAANIANVGSNWSGGAVGSGMLRRGHSDSSPNSECSADLDDAKAYVETTCTGTSTGTFSQRRTSYLSNGAVVWDIGGNIYNWVDYFNDLDSPIPAVNADKEFIDVKSSITTPMAHLVPRNSAQPWWRDYWSSAQGIGMVRLAYPLASYGATARGGSYYDGALAGVFRIYFGLRSYDYYGSYGFRCAWQP